MSDFEGGPAEIGMAIRKLPVSIVLTDPRLDDNPITYVNDAFQQMSLYSREYAIGRNCRFLQGPETSPADVEKLRDGMREGREFQVTITNHRADGTAFRNQLLIAPVHDDNGNLTAYFGVLRVVPPETNARAGLLSDDNLSLLQEIQHRVKNHLAMVVSMIRIQASREVTRESMEAVSRRVEALALLYDELLSSKMNRQGSDIPAGAYLSRIASVVSGLEARGAIRVNIECEDISLPVDQAARLGLLLSEFLTNALEHAFEGRDAGLVEIRFRRLSDGRVRLSVEDDGNGMPADSHWPFSAPTRGSERDKAPHASGEPVMTGRARKAGIGGSIVAALTRSLGASLTVATPESGTIITVDIDPEG